MASVKACVEGEAAGERARAGLAAGERARAGLALGGACAGARGARVWAVLAQARRESASLRPPERPHAFLFLLPFLLFLPSPSPQALTLFLALPFRQYKAALLALGPDARQNHPWQLAAVKRRFAALYGGAVTKNMVAAAAVIEMEAAARGIPRPA